ncbi:MAG: hypothetical protein FJX80_00355 [Bacteroidetes bacterium]|nr:hypothetical protein [Bacteroidota bacterium]
MPTELISLFGGAITGFIFRIIAAKAEESRARFDRMMKAIDKRDDSADKALKRDGDIGKVVRQFIVISVIFSIVISPFVMAILGIPTYLEVDYSTGTSLFGLIGNEATNKAFVEISGNLITAEIRQCLIAVTGFYFGSASASNKS